MTDTAAQDPYVDQQHVIAAEQSVVGSMMLAPSAIRDVLDTRLSPDDFYVGAHRTVFEAIMHVFDAGDPVDLATVTDRLAAVGQLEGVGDVPAIAEMVNHAIPPNVVAHARIVRKASRWRRTNQAFDEARQIVRQAGVDDPDAAIEAAEERLRQAADDSRPVGPQVLHDVLDDVICDMEAAYDRGGHVQGLPTGFRDLDALTGGLHSGTLTVWAARPSMGKSALVTNVAAHVAIRQQQPVLLFSLEMSTAEIVRRVFAAEGPMSSDRLRSGQLTESDWAALSSALTALGSAPLWIDETPDVSLAQIRSRARRVQQQHGLGLVVVDYLQLMSGRAESRQVFIAEVSRGLKTLAKELDVPIVALSQLNRKVEEREDKRPRLSDLRESGAVEQDADVVAFLYRDEVYEPMGPPGVAELIVAKHRGGETGTVMLGWEAEHTRFVDADRMVAPPVSTGTLAHPQPVGVAGGWDQAGGGPVPM